jgi:hypothetical protein
VPSLGFQFSKVGNTGKGNPALRVIGPYRPSLSTPSVRSTFFTACSVSGPKSRSSAKFPRPRSQLMTSVAHPIEGTRKYPFGDVVRREAVAGRRGLRDAWRCHGNDHGRDSPRYVARSSAVIQDRYFARDETLRGDSQESGQLRRAASARCWSSSRPIPLAACTAMPKAKVVM